MLQRALRAGVIGRRYIEPGETFEHAERMNWATPVEPVVVEVPASKAAGGKKRAAPAEPAEAPASAEAGPDADLI